VESLNPGVFLAATATGGGLWFVVRLIVRYQRDFTDRYVERLGVLEAKLLALEEIVGNRDSTIRERDRMIEDLNRRLIACGIERGALRAMMRQHSIEWNPTDWGAIPDDR
jgi:hypothetical protein